MTRLVLTLCILTGSSSWSMADDLAMAASPSDISHTILGGTVKFVSRADPAKGTKSEIVVVNAAKKTTHVLVTSTTTLWDMDEKPITLDEIIAKSKVNVIYFTTDEGINIGRAIKILR